MDGLWGRWLAVTFMSFMLLSVVGIFAFESVFVTDQIRPQTQSIRSVLLRRTY